MKKVSKFWGVMSFSDGELVSLAFCGKTGHARIYTTRAEAKIDAEYLANKNPKELFKVKELEILIKKKNV